MQRLGQCSSIWDYGETSYLRKTKEWLTAMRKIQKNKRGGMANAKMYTFLSKILKCFFGYIN